MNDYKRHDISDAIWEVLAPHLPGQRNQKGGTSKDSRLFINAVSWIIRTGAPWRDLPPSYGNWNSQAKRYRRWVKKGIWTRLLEIFADKPELEWLLISTLLMSKFTPMQQVLSVVINIWSV